MARRISRRSVAPAYGVGIACLIALGAWFGYAQQPTPLTPEQQAVVSHISANSLRGHVSFLASDLLEGRGTPSRGLDIAAEYIASEFRRAGLQPAGDDGYFQTAAVTVREPNYEGFHAVIHPASGEPITLQPTDVYLTPPMAITLDQVPVLTLEESTQVTPDRINGSVVLIESPRAARKLQGLRPVLTLRVVETLPRPQLLDEGQAAPDGSIGYLAQPAIMNTLRGVADARISLHSAAASERKAQVRNVAGILRGSDASLQDTYVLLTSHYDHVGMSRSTEAADRIYNGANDDASGTSSVLEVASAMGAMRMHPKRSILFMTFYGEEQGLRGSRFYSQHPLVPPSKTIAHLNLEQIGRTDAADGPQIKTASITGFDFSDMPAILAEAARSAGIRVYKNSQASDAFFPRSDNQPLADMGIPAHTLCVAFEFPDYHRVTDTWDKIDYDNMAAVNRAIALGMMKLASDAPPPKWNEAYAPAAKYVEAGKKLYH